MKKRIVTALGVLIAGLFLFGIAAVAAGGYGTSSDPLVSLSYLTDVFTSDMDQLITEKVDAKTAELRSDLDGRVLALEQQLSGTAGGTATVSVNYTALNLRNGDVLRLEPGTELILRSGAAASDTALSDLSGGGSLPAGNDLSANHLYVALENNAGLFIYDGTLLLIRGGYSLG